MFLRINVSLVHPWKDVRFFDYVIPGRRVIFVHSQGTAGHVSDDNWLGAEISSFQTFH